MSLLVSIVMYAGSWEYWVKARKHGGQPVWACSHKPNGLEKLFGGKVSGNVNLAQTIFFLKNLMHHYLFLIF